MAAYQRKAAFSQTEAGTQALEALHAMCNKANYNTPSSYCSNSEAYPENQRSFVDKHMDYLSTHPDVNPNHYISNLRLMTRIK